ncbi:hypothetical protein ACFLQN_01970 [Candidatus Aenigmatarchaeota archaeon]
MKGITPTISIILIMVIVIVLVGFSFAIFQNVIDVSGDAATSTIEEQSRRAASCMRLESVAGDTVYVRNCGNADLEDFSVYVGDAPVGLLGAYTVPPGEVGAIQYDLSGLGLPPGDYPVRVTSSALATDQRTFYIETTIPSVLLIVPGDGQIFLPSANVDFSCDASDDDTVIRLDLSVDLGGGLVVQEGPCNPVGEGTSAASISCQLTVSASDGPYQWNCEAEDNDANIVTKTRTFNVDSGSPGTAPIITHTTVTESMEQEDLLITATVYDEDEDLASATLNYKTRPAGSYSQLAMNIVPLGGGNYDIDGTIPGAGIIYHDGLEYYIEVVDGEANPDSTTNQIVDVMRITKIENDEFDEWIYFDGHVDDDGGIVPGLQNMRIGDQGGTILRRGFIDFITQPIPNNSLIDEVYLSLNRTSDLGNNEIHIRKFTVMPAFDYPNGDALFLAIDDENTYADYIIPGGVDNYLILLDQEDAPGDVEGQLGDNWFTVGIMTSELFDERTLFATSENADPGLRPVLHVKHHKADAFDDVTPPVIVHTPITTTILGEDIIIDAMITDTEGAIQTAYINYGEPGNVDTRIQLFEITPGQYQGIIYGGAGPAGIEYNIETTDDSDNLATDGNHIITIAAPLISLLITHDAIDRITDGHIFFNGAVESYTRIEGLNYLFIGKNNNGDTYRGYLEFNIVDVPDNAIIDSVKFMFRRNAAHFGDQEPTIMIRNFPGELVNYPNTQAGNEALFNILFTLGTIYRNDILLLDSVDFYDVDLGPNAVQELDDQLEVGDWFSLGLHTDETYFGVGRIATEEWATITDRPILNVTYHLP